ncbi:MAG: O-antigen ligase family protein [Clostridia bacterium]|nr:O-antigen ligase family protein [Clostridia bacterium]
MQHRVAPFWKKYCTWQTLMALFVVYEMLALCARHYNSFYIDRLWPQIGFPLTIGFAGAVLSRANMRNRPGMRWLIAYFFWYLAVLIINRWYLAHEFTDFRLVLYRLLFVTLVCYPLGNELATRQRTARAVFCTLAGAMAVMAAIGFFCVVFQTHWYAPYRHGAVGLLMERGTGLRLYLFAHPNIAGAALMMTMLLCVYLWLTAKCRVAKVWHGLCFVFHFLALALTMSRAAMQAASAGMALLPFLWVFDRMRASRPRLAWLAGIASAALGAALCFAGLNLVTRGAGNILQMDFLSQREQLGNTSLFSGRPPVWGAALRTLGSYPTLLIKGATLERLMLTVRSQVPDVAGWGWAVHLHNTYLTVLVGMGLPAFLLLLGFLWRLAQSSLRLILRAGASFGQRFLPAILLGSLLVGMMEPFFFTGQYFVDRLFFIVAGIIVVIAGGKNEEAIQ